VTAQQGGAQPDSVQLEHLAALYSLGAGLDPALGLPLLLERVMAAVVTLTGADRGYLALAGDDGALQTVVVHNLEWEASEGGSPPLSRGAAARVMATGEAVLGEESPDEGHFEGLERRSLLCAPLPARGRIVGVTFVDKPLQSGAFQPADLELLAAFASQAAITIEDARRFQEMEQILARLEQQARAAHEAKSDFISLVTHELRIPMTSIRGYTDLLLAEIAGPLSEPQQEFVTTIRRNVERMSVLVRDLADINRLDSGRMAFEPEVFDLNEVVEEVARDFREATARRQQAVTVAPSPLPLLVRADRARLGQALANLVSNANQYTPNGGAICLRAETSEAMATISITDDGIGISPEDQQRLFTQFFRSEDEAVRAQTGWGLGLAITRKLVEAQGGQVSCRSTLRGGSTFTLRLPLVEGASHGQ
jgi:signal transduction histidine kinase